MWLAATTVRLRFIAFGKVLLAVGKVSLVVGKPMLASEHRLPQVENPLPDNEARYRMAEWGESDSA